MGRPGTALLRIFAVLITFVGLFSPISAAATAKPVSVVKAKPAAVTPMVSINRSRIAATAAREVGYAGSGSQCTKYTSSCVDWCAAFTNWVWRNSGVASAPTTLVARGVGQWGVERGLFKSRGSGFGNPRPGDIVVYGAPGNVVGGHVSIVESVGNGVITTIDGNYNNRVARRTINPLTARAGAQNLLISGYVRPPGYTDGDVSGDNGADLLATKTDGTMIYCPNNAGSNPGGVPFTGCMQTGAGWDSATTVVEGDFSGDGSVDVVATQLGGALIYCPNNAGGNPGGVPFTGCVQTGSGWDQVIRIFAGDYSGDGAADLVGIRSGGALIYCPNNAGSNPGGVPFSSCVQTGSGWDVARQTVAADFSGDGGIDLVSVDVSGNLVYCPNNAGSNPGGVPFTGCIPTGSGWGTTSIYGGDFSGDGASDLLGIRGDGTMIYCPNNAGSNPGGAPFAGCVQTGTGWQSAVHVVTADYSGDGSADLLATKQDGTLIYCPNNSGSNPGGVPFTGCAQTGSGWGSANRLLTNRA